jgi:predicted nucleotide-binding protein
MVMRRGKQGMDAVPPRRPTLTVPRHEAEEKLNAQIRQGELLVNRESRRTERELQNLRDDSTTWEEYTATVLRSVFDTDEYAAEFSRFISTMSYPDMPMDERWEQDRDAVAEKLRRLRSITLRLPMIAEPAPAHTSDRKTVIDSRAVFVVHGHDKALKESVARLLEKLALKPVILHEQPNMGRTVIEKFEAHSVVGFAVVLLTPDDIGGMASAPDKLNPRARQNVVLELGYFLGKLGRARVCAIYEGDVEIPSDIHGVLYIPYDAGGGWRLRLATEIKAAGIDVDLNQSV